VFLLSALFQTFLKPFLEYLGYFGVSFCAVLSILRFGYLILRIIFCSICTLLSCATPPIVAGTVNITTPFYSGEGYHYLMQLASTEAVDSFWYVTTPEGLPVQQGEGGTDAETPAGKGVFVYHSYNMTAWAQPANIESSVFAVPDVCRTTTSTCAMP